MANKHKSLPKTEIAWTLIRKGASLQEPEARILELDLQQNTANVEARIQLYGYFQERALEKGGDNEINQQLCRCVSWFVENHPESDLHRFLQVYKKYPCEASLKKLWVRQLKEFPNNWKITVNAADYLSGVDDQLSIRCFKKALKLKAGYGLPARRLAHKYFHKAESMTGSSRARVLDKGLSFADLALKLKDSHGEKNGLLLRSPPFAIERNKIDLARRWARTLCRRGRDEKIYSFLVYGLIFLTSLDLIEGSISRALKRLDQLYDVIRIDRDSLSILEKPIFRKVLQSLYKSGNIAETRIVIRSLKSLYGKKFASSPWPAIETQLSINKEPKF